MKRIKNEPREAWMEGLSEAKCPPGLMYRCPLGEGEYERRIWNNYMNSKKMMLDAVDEDTCVQGIVSELNWADRYDCGTSEEFGIIPAAGDICYIDYGNAAFKNEIGYQHFGLIVSIFLKKALVIPMTGNEEKYMSAYDPSYNPSGKCHLMRLGKVPGMTKPSVLYMNDLKYINTARIISRIAHLDPESRLFWQIQLRMLEIVFQKPDEKWLRKMITP